MIKSRSDKYMITEPNNNNNEYNNRILFLNKKLNNSFKSQKSKSKNLIRMNSLNKNMKLILPNISSNSVKLNEKREINSRNNTFKRRVNSLNNIKSIYPKKILMERLLYLRKKFASKKYMSKGELTEMIYGNKIQLCNFDIKKNKRLKEIMYNRPKFIIDLIEFGFIPKDEIKEFFNIDSFNITWNENLEKAYREIRKTNTNIFKIILFLSKTHLLSLLKQIFEVKNYMNYYNYNQKEIEKIYDIYETLNKYEYSKIKLAYDKIDNIYYKRELLLIEKINQIRNDYYSKKLKNFSKIKKIEFNIKKSVEKGKTELIEIKNCIFHVRQKINWKIFPYKEINRIKFKKPITKLNEIINKDIDINNIKIKDKIKNEKIYLKEKIKILKNEKILFNKSNFNWNNFMKENNDNKKIIEYYIIMIQSHFRSFLIKVFLSKLINSVDKIIIYLNKYTKFKKLILQMYEITFKEKNCDENINKINKVVKIMIKNCKTRKLIFNNYETNLINKIIEVNIGILPIKANKEIYSSIPLLNLNKFLSYLIIHKNI